LRAFLKTASLAAYVVLHHAAGPEESWEYPVLPRPVLGQAGK